MRHPPSFRITRSSAHARSDVWDALWDLEIHSRVIPFTTVTLVPTEVGHESGLREGSRFDARTHLGPLTIDDVMRVDRWDPPAEARIVKVGRVFGGTITVRLSDVDGGSRLDWHQTYSVHGLPDIVAWLAVPLVRAGYVRTLSRIIGSQEPAG